MHKRKIAVDLNTPPEPSGRLGIPAELRLGDPDEQHPAVGEGVARRQPERLPDVILRLDGAAYEILGHTAMRVGQIAIQRQRAFAFADSRDCPDGKHVDRAERQMAPA